MINVKAIGTWIADVLTLQIEQWEWVSKCWAKDRESKLGAQHLINMGFSI